MDQIIGTCSLCGGAVTLPMMSTHPVASCARCGAKPKTPYGPTVEMDPKTRRFEREKDCPSHDTRCTLERCFFDPR